MGIVLPVKSLDIKYYKDNNKEIYKLFLCLKGLHEKIEKEE